MDVNVVIDDPYLQPPPDPLARVRLMLQERARAARQPQRHPRSSGSIYACPGRKLCRTHFPEGDDL